MARVTRSKKIEVAEDNTALAVSAAIDTAIEAPFVTSTQPLTDLLIDSNEMASNDDREISSLKAAYRSALGMGKNKKKGKGKKVDQENINQEQLFESQSAVDTADAGKSFSENMDAPNVVNSEPLAGAEPAPMPKRRTRKQEALAQQGLLDSQAQDQSISAAVSIDNSAESDSTAVPIESTSKQDNSEENPSRKRITRQQSANKGQFNLLLGQQDHTHGLGAVRDYLLSLLRDYPDASSRASSSLIFHDDANSGHDKTDPQLFLAKIAAEETVKQALVHDPQEIEASSTQTNPESVALTNNETPKSPMKTLAKVEEEESTKAPSTPSKTQADDSFVGEITSRSPAKPVSRIEDSVEALDQLEDALEAIDQAALAERVASPEKSRNEVPVQKPAPKKTITKEAKSSTLRGHNPIKTSVKPGHASMRVKQTTVRPSVVKKSVSMIFESPRPKSVMEEKPIRDPRTKISPSKRPISLLLPKDLAKSSKPPTVPSKFELPGEAVARRLKEQREARQAQRESSEEASQKGRSAAAPKIKSTKAPTRPTFELPGEAISRRKKEAHEAKIKAQEEEDRKRREFKAKPMRNNVAASVAPRDTVASRARQNKIDNGTGENSLTVSKRGSNVGAHRPSIAQLINEANSSAPRTKAPAPIERKPSTKFHGPAMSGLAMQRTVSSEDVLAQRQRAREIYNRDNQHAEDIEREKREREAAARRSREEAAERGRQASREWAEKQKAKKLAEGDKGMAPGYGPGGQLGLKA